MWTSWVWKRNMWDWYWLPLQIQMRLWRWLEAHSSCWGRRGSSRISSLHHSQLYVYLQTPSNQNTPYCRIISNSASRQRLCFVGEFHIMLYLMHKFTAGTLDYSCMPAAPPVAPPPRNMSAFDRNFLTLLSSLVSYDTRVYYKLGVGEICWKWVYKIVRFVDVFFCLTVGQLAIISTVGKELACLTAHLPTPTRASAGLVTPISSTSRLSPATMTVCNITLPYHLMKN